MNVPVRWRCSCGSHWATPATLLSIRKAKERGATMCMPVMKPWNALAQNPLSGRMIVTHATCLPCRRGGRHQLLLLRVDGEHGNAALEACLGLRVDMLELSVAIGMLRSLHGLVRGL